MRKKSPEQLLPLMPAEFQILMALVDAERHGYGIMAEVRERTGGSVVLGPGILYGTLKRLVSRNLAEPAGEHTDEGDWGRGRRRYYRLTDLGLQIARAEAARLAAVVGDARRKRLIAKSGETG